MVVGSGLAGLAAARKLALLGHPVLILERGRAAGGHLLPFKRGGRLFEVGVHYVADCGPGSLWQSAWASLGVQHLPCTALADPFERLSVTQESSLDAWPDLRQYSHELGNHLELLRRTLPQHLEAIKKLARDFEIIWSFAQQLRFPIETANALGYLARHGLRKPAEACRLVRLATLTVHDYFLHELGFPESALDFFALHHLLIGCSPREMDTLRYLLIQRYYFAGASSVDGGGQAMIEALSHPKVNTLCSCEVVHIRDDAQADNRAQPKGSLAKRPRYSVEAWDLERQVMRTFHCAHVIWTPDPRQLLRVCRFELPWVLRLRLARARNPHALVVGYFGLDHMPAEFGIDTANYWLLGQLSSMAGYETDDLLELARQGSVFVSPGRDVKQAADKAQPAEGVIQAMFLVPPEASPWGGTKPTDYRVSERNGGFRRHYLSLKSQLLDILTERLQHTFPAVTGHITWQELGTPLTHHRYLNSDSLGGYGFASTRADLLWARPSFRSGRKGLYLAGAHTRPSHGLLTALLSGLGVAEHVAKSG